jgi:plastocyanin
MSKRVVFSVLGFVGFIAVGFTATARADRDGKTPAPVQIRMRDFCDQTTFDAAAGPGTCKPIVAPGYPGMPFGFFIKELVQDRSVGEWRFNPNRIDVEEGTKLTLTNLGGETHTFTRVEKFGGGFVAPLNAPSGNPVPVSECAQTLPDGSLAPQPESPDNLFVEAGTTEQGPTIREGDGAVRFQCCIHPWMRLVVSHKDEDRRR